MILMIIPLGKLSLGGISEKYLPPNNSVRLAQEEFDKIFPGFRTEPLTLVIKRDDGQPVTDQHLAILALLRAGNGEEAAHMIEDHIKLTQTRLTRLRL